MARRLVWAACAVWGMEGLAEDAALVVSELVGNAVRHARRESVRVVVERPAPGTVRVAVSDFSTRVPELCVPGAGADGGRGLLLVAGLSVRWGSEVRRWGKVIRAEVGGGR